MKKTLYIIFLFLCSFTNAQTLEHYEVIREIQSPEVVAVTFETEYQAVLDEATTQGYTLPSSSDQIIQNAKVISAKSSGVWADSDRIFVFTESGDADFKKLNWKNPTGAEATETFNGTSGALTYTSTGVKGDGVNILNLNYNPSSNGVNFTQNDAGIYVNVVTAKTSFEIALGGFNTTGYIRVRNGDGVEQRINSVNNDGVNQNWSATTGLLGVSRNTSADLITSVNTATTTTADPSAAINNSTLSLFGYNTATLQAWTRGDMEIGYVIIGADMSDILADIKAAFD